MWLLVLSLLYCDAADTSSHVREEVSREERIQAVINDRDLSGMDKDERVEMATWFIQYGKRWNVDPILLACIAAKESGFRASPPPLIYCKTRIERGKAVKVCKRRRLEEGMMQSIPNLKVTKRGYWFCTGKVLANRSDLRDRRASICVGAYELSSRKMWVSSRIKRRGKIRSRSHRHSRYLRKIIGYGKQLISMFWSAATYNWGPRILKRNKGRYDSLGYPIRVMRCYTKYAYNWTRSVGAERASGKSKGESAVGCSN